MEAQQYTGRYAIAYKSLKQLMRRKLEEREA
jgi:hypothetical protein